MTVDAVEADGVYEVLEKNMKTQLDQVKGAVEELTMAFKPLLTQGVQRYHTSVEEMRLFLDRVNVTTLRKIVDRNQPNTENILNIKLASCLTKSIDERFKNCFSNDCETGSLIEVISRFSLGTNLLIPKYKDVKQQMEFLQTRENKIKEKIKTKIIQEKEAIYNSLIETIKKNMEKGYDDACRISGENVKHQMRETITKHISTKMYNDAKNTMLGKINTLKMTICNELKGTMEYFIKLLFKADVRPIPDLIPTQQQQNDPHNISETTLTNSMMTLQIGTLPDGGV